MFKILLINDVKTLAEMERSFLKRMACRILISEGGSDALEKAKQEKPDIIVLDSSLLSVGVFDLCRRLKSTVETKEIPVISFVSSEETEKCIQAGCDSVLNEPITRESFLKALSGFLKVVERGTERVPIVKKVRCNMQDSFTAELFSKDLSVSGIFLKSKDPLPIGSILEMDLLLSRKGSKQVHVSGEVVRRVEHEEDSHLISGMGVKFMEMKAMEQITIQSFLQGKHPENPIHG